MRDADDQRLFVDHRIAIAIFRAVIDFDRNARGILEQKLSHQPGMPRCAACDHVHALEALPLFRREFEIVEVDVARFLEHPSVECVAHAARLFVDLFEHVVPVAFLFGHHGIPGNTFRRPIDGSIALVEHADSFLIGHRVLAVLEIDDVARVSEERCDVGGHDVFVLAEADDEWRAVLGRDDCPRLGAVDHHQRIVTFELLECLLDRLDELRTALEFLLNEMRDHFGVGLGVELMPGFLQLLFERQEILDDPVVDHDDLTGAVTVRMRVVLVRLAVRGPSGVTHAERSLQRFVAQLGFEIRQLAFGAHHFHSVAIHNGDSGTVVAAIFELFQPADENGHHVACADVTDDSAHFVVRSPDPLSVRIPAA